MLWAGKGVKGEFRPVHTTQFVGIGATKFLYHYFGRPPFIGQPKIYTNTLADHSLGGAGFFLAFRLFDLDTNGHRSPGGLRDARKGIDIQ